MVKQLAQFLGGTIPKKLFNALLLELHPDRWEGTAKQSQALELTKDLTSLRRAG